MGEQSGRVRITYARSDEPCLAPALIDCASSASVERRLWSAEFVSPYQRRAVNRHVSYSGSCGASQGVGQGRRTWYRGRLADSLGAERPDGGSDFEEPHVDVR
jgi:hypothetical protein